MTTLVVAFLAPPVFGQSTWTGGNSGNWNSASNWSGGTPSGNTTVTLGNGSITADATIRLNGSRNAGNITANATTFNYIFDGNPGGTLNLSVTSGTPTIEVTSSNRTLTITNNNGIDGTQGIAKIGAGTLLLQGTSTYTGGTTLSAGTIQIGNTAALGNVTNTLTINAGTLDLNGTSITVGNLTGTGGIITSTSATNRTLFIGEGNGTGGNYQGIIADGSGSTALTKNGTGTITLSGNNTFSGATFVTGGTLEIGNGGTTGSLATSSAITNNATLSFNRSNTITQGTHFASVIGGSGIVSQRGAGGSLILNGVNTYTGATRIRAGALVVGGNAPSGAAGALGNSTTAVVLGTANTGSSDGPSLLIGGNFTVGRGVTVGSEANTNAYNATIGGSNTSGTSTFSGNITLNTTASAYTVAVQSATGGTVDFTTGTWTTNNKAVAVGTSGNTGTVRLSNTLGTTGGISVNFGTLLLGSSNRIGDTTPVTVAGGILDTGSGLTDTVATFAMSSGSVNGTGTITAATYGLSGGTVNGNLGAGTLTVSGSSNLNGTAAAATVNITAGTLTLGSANRFTGSPAVTMTNAASAILALAGNSQSIGSLAGGGPSGGNVSLGSGTLTTGSSNATTSYAGVISGSGGGLTKAGTGAFTLTGANTYSGGTTVSAGTLRANNTTGSATGTGAITVNAGTFGGTGSVTGALTVNTGGTLSPGVAIETLASGAVTFNTGSTFAYEVNSAVLTSIGADLQIVSGNLSLFGVVNLAMTDLAASPVAFAQNTKFTVANYSGTWNGGLFTVGGNAIADDGTFVAGLNTWRLDYNATSGGLNFSGEYVHANYVNIVAVPEPPMLALLAASGLGLWVIRRRRVMA
jgi:autotransporter-associated beta strand protein